MMKKDEGKGPCPDDRKHLAAGNTGLAATAVMKAAGAAIRASEVEFDDMMGAAMIGLVRAARDWDETKNVKYSTLAFVYAYNEVRASLSHLRSLSKRPEKPTVSLSAFQDDILASTQDDSNSDLGDLLALVMSRLSLGQALALHLLYELGMPLSDAATVMGISTGKLISITKRARGNARECIEWTRKWKGRTA